MLGAATTLYLPVKRFLESLGLEVKGEGRVEDGRGSLWPMAKPRFPSPLIKPCVQVSRTRLSDWIHRKGHGGWSVELMSCGGISARNSLRLAI